MSESRTAVEVPLPAEASVERLPFEPSAAYSNPLQDDVLLAPNQGKRIGILIVTYNALSTLTKLLKRITPNVWNNVEEIAVFDDASSDATFELAFGLKALRDLPKLQVLRHPKNLGYGGNQKAGYQYFIDKGFDLVVLLHGDGQYAPEILSHLYHPIVTGEADAVFGSRMMKEYGGALKGGMPLYKYAGNRVLSVFENRALGLALTEFHSGYRAYNLHALRKIDFTHMTNDFHFDTEIIIKLHHQNYSIKEVPIPSYYGTEICYVNGMKYAADVVRAVYRYTQTCRSVRPYPEFREYFIPYPIKQSKYSSHYYARKMVGSNQQVLEIGCGEGLLAAELQKNGNRVTGVDAMPGVQAGSALEQYFSADLDQGMRPVVDALKGKRFDRVLLLDILEHLKSPETLLRDCHEVVNPDGIVIVSLPNVANITVRLKLLLGQFKYADRGILDSRHMRFFTRTTARRLLESNGFEVLTQKMAVMPLELVIGLPPENFVMRLINRTLAVLTRIMPGLMGYQTVLLAQSRRSAQS
jgi:2-polyprenyl-3-methyl-5-hydroxy-6-metoxy-1,4-benzoquinol methylase